MSKHTHQLCLLIQLFAIWGATASAKNDVTLSFDKATQEVTATPDQKQITITFTFENRSKETIEITKHTSVCACLSTTFKGGKNSYTPGEKGELSATFKLGSLYGSQTKKILLWQKGDAPDNPSIALTCKVTIPELFSFEPRNLSWDLGDDATEKTSILTVHDKEPIRIINSRTTNRNFELKVETIRAGWEYKLTIKPKKTNTPSFGIIRVTTDSKHSRFKHGQLFAYIRRPTDKQP